MDRKLKEEEILGPLCIAVHVSELWSYCLRSLSLFLSPSPKDCGAPAPSHVTGVLRGPAFHKLHLTHLKLPSLLPPNKNSDPSSWRPPRRFGPVAGPANPRKKRKVVVRGKYGHQKLWHPAHPFWKAVWQGCVTNLKKFLTLDGCRWEHEGEKIRNYSFTKTVTAILFTAGPSWKWPKCSITKLNSFLYIYQMVYALLPIKMMTQNAAWCHREMLMACGQLKTAAY